MSNWNRNRFSVYTSDEKSALGLIEELGKQTNYNTDELENKTDKYGDHKGTWQGLSKPTLSDEGMRATVEKHDSDIINISAAINTIITSGLKGKKYSSMGTSITYGFVDKPYGQIVSEEMGLIYNNMGVSGSHMVYENDEQIISIFANRANIPTDADVISVECGTNDYGHSKMIGDSDSKSFYNLYGAIKVFIEWVQENRPKAKIFFITPLCREGMYEENELGYQLQDYVNVIKDVCENYSVPVLDLYSDGTINPNIPAHKSLYANDGLHINQLGHEIVAKKVVEFMRGL